MVGDTVFGAVSQTCAHDIHIDADGRFIRVRKRLAACGKAKTIAIKPARFLHRTECFHFQQYTGRHPIIAYDDLVAGCDLFAEQMPDQSSAAVLAQAV